MHYIALLSLLHLGSYWVILDHVGSGPIKGVTPSRSPPRDKWLFPIQLHHSVRRRPAMKLMAPLIIVDPQSVQSSWKIV